MLQTLVPACQQDRSLLTNLTGQTELPQSFLSFAAAISNVINIQRSNRVERPLTTITQFFWPSAKCWRMSFGRPTKSAMCASRSWNKWCVHWRAARWVIFRSTFYSSISRTYYNTSGMAPDQTDRCLICPQIPRSCCVLMIVASSLNMRSRAPVSDLPKSPLPPQTFKQA